MATAAEITAITSLSSSADTAAGAGAGADFVTLTAGESAGLLLFFSLAYMVYIYPLILIKPLSKQFL